MSVSQILQTKNTNFTQENPRYKEMRKNANVKGLYQGLKTNKTNKKQNV